MFKKRQFHWQGFNLIFTNLSYNVPRVIPIKPQKIGPFRSNNLGVVTRPPTWSTRPTDQLTHKPTNQPTNQPENAMVSIDPYVIGYC